MQGRRLLSDELFQQGQVALRLERLEMRGVDLAQQGVLVGSRRLPPLGRRAQRLEVLVGDADLLEPGGELAFREARAT